jgi:hypothetical protein
VFFGFFLLFQAFSWGLVIASPATVFFDNFVKSTLFVSLFKNSYASFLSSRFGTLGNLPFGQKLAKYWAMPFAQTVRFCFH